MAIVKPDYVDPSQGLHDASLAVRPPFLFSGVTARVFPLKANMATLAGFCDAYVNMDIPPEIVHYRPALPYVYLMVLDYGSMSSASMHAQNVGWVAQHEVAFTVPLQRWRRENGRMVFKDWACVSPFIFVDDEMSLTTGREVYGWPKVAGTVEDAASMWARHPQAGSRVFAFSTQVFPHVYAGDAEQPRMLLTIDTDPGPSFARFPLDPGSNWAPWNAFAQAARSSLSLAGQAADMALGMRMRGFRGGPSVSSIKAMGSRLVDYVSQMAPVLMPARGAQREAIINRSQAPGLAFDNITVKQFRDAQHPDQACYKALVRSRMGVQRVNGSGLLGDANLLRGDTSGGYTVRVHRYTSQPIIESLGIEVKRTEDLGDGVAVSVLKPVFPFWNDVDLFYAAGEPVCSCIYAQGSSYATGWVDEQAPDSETPVLAVPDNPPPPAPEPAPAEPAADADGAQPECAGDYNTALGAATQPVAGPFHFPDVTLQVYPLLADRARLDAFVQHYLNDTLADAGMAFETVGSYAYLVVNVIGDQTGTMWSSANNIGWWASREVSFCVPVRWYRVDPDTGEKHLLSLALVAPFVYASNGRAVITDREVNGRPSVQAEIDSPKDAWLESSGPVHARRFLRLSTEVFPAVGVGQRAEQRTLLEVDGLDVLPYNDDVGWRMVGEQWGHELVTDLIRKQHLAESQQAEIEAARAMALELLAHGKPFNWLILKQYRDAADINKACYQALVRAQRCVERVYDLREIEDRVHVRVHRYPGHPISQTLGLKLKSIDSSGGAVVENLQPIRPFWARLSVREELAEVVAVRRSDGQWDRLHPWLQSREPSRSGYGTPDAQPRGARAMAADRQAPYFQAAGQTRVSPRWPAGPQRLREQQLRLLAASVAASLQSLRTTCQALPEADLSALQAGLPTTEGRLLQRLLALPADAAVAEWADGHAVGELLSLERACHAAGLDFGARDAAQRRLSRAEARTAMDALVEIQLVVESILGQEWEHWGNPRWFRRDGTPAKPEPCVPAHSLHGGLDALRRLLPASVEAQEERQLMRQLSKAVGRKLESSAALRIDQVTSGEQAWICLRRDTSSTEGSAGG